MEEQEEPEEQFPEFAAEGSWETTSYVFPSFMTNFVLIFAGQTFVGLDDNFAEEEAFSNEGGDEGPVGEGEEDS